MAGIVDREIFKHYVDGVLRLIQEEIRPPPVARDGTIKPIANLDSLTCLKQLLKNYATYFLERNRLDMLQIINDIFYSGYNKQVIEVLGQISEICGGRFKRAAQVKLLNSCYIILT